jgi:hypothetical protein
MVSAKILARKVKREICVKNVAIIFQKGYYQSCNGNFVDF